MTEKAKAKEPVATKAKHAFHRFILRDRRIPSRLTRFRPQMCFGRRYRRGLSTGISKKLGPHAVK